MNERRVQSSERPAARKNIREDWAVQECVVARLIGDDDGVPEDVLHAGSDTFNECRIAEREECLVRSHSAACAPRKDRSRDVLQWNHVPLTTLSRSGGEKGNGEEQWECPQREIRPATFRPETCSLFMPSAVDHCECVQHTGEECVERLGDASLGTGQVHDECLAAQARARA